ncbi:hypothetical protein [Chryseobacterium wangxinyae]|uniref:hypothetical protein n=1 Tax=unclassified Chryseobacterium TaxID=2593645 RepID=UPI00226FE69E|nr:MULTISPECIES: hypothetical protein [unclassified Chryseobacterium]MCY0967836.1 hypothetical protein [Chryseobacterium sp. CY353]MCY0978186.1 hypothetical protein [Chryseobacterium sp. CY350]WBZ95270.1 hypothetical protein PGH12_17655 [Chryseobacterium sp. CY350]
MKKLWIAAISGLLFLASCADKKENREEFKTDHNKDYMRNDLGDSAVANSEQNAGDTTNLANDTLKKPTDYKSKESNPNTKVGGSR